MLTFAHHEQSIPLWSMQKGGYMKYSGFLFGALLSAHAFADTSPPAVPHSPVIPLNQNLAVVDYFGDDRQAGCGLRITGETKDDLWLNVLITVFMKGTGATFGVIKVVARKVNVKDDVPLLQDGKITYANIGKIRKAWIKPDSVKEPLIYKNGELSHNDAYMVSADFASTMDLLVAISQESFKVGLNRNEDGPDDVFQFDKRLDQSEADRLFSCMNNLRVAIEGNKRKESF
jgi:hypothetical protein